MIKSGFRKFIWHVRLDGLLKDTLTITLTHKKTDIFYEVKVHMHPTWEKIMCFCQVWALTINIYAGSFLLKRKVVNDSTIFFLYLKNASTAVNTFFL